MGGSSLSDRLTQHFYDFEQWGQGRWFTDEPIALEPLLPVFDRRQVVALNPPVDDGQVHTLTSWLRQFVNPKPILPPSTHPANPFTEAPTVRRDPYVADERLDLVEYQLRLPNDTPVSVDRWQQLLVMLGTAQFPISFELIGTGTEIITQLACRRYDEAFVLSQLKAFFPDLLLKQEELRLFCAVEDPKQGLEMVDLSLEEEFMRPLLTSSKLDPDPLTAAIGVLNQLVDEQVGVVQILFQGAKGPWRSNTLQSVTDGQGGAFFGNSPEMLPLAKEKVGSPLFSVGMRVMGNSGKGDLQESLRIAYDLAKALHRSTAKPGSNALTTLESYLDYDDMLAAAHARRTYRLGTILNVQELTTFVHPLAASVRSSKIKPLPKSRPVGEGQMATSYLLGYHHHQGQALPLGMSEAERLRHLHIIGATGTGKSTLLVNLIRHDITSGTGCAVFDPHGDLIDEVLGYIDETTRDRVVVIDPSDPNYAVGMNILEATTEAEKLLLASDIANVFKRHTTSWGDQMEVMLQNTIAAFLDHPQGGTLLHLRRFLVDKGFREAYVEGVEDPIIRDYFEYDFPTKRTSSLQSLLSRLQLFLRPKPVRYLLMQQNSLKLSTFMDQGALIFIKLSQGLIGESNSYLLGSLLLAKFYQAALGRQLQSKADRQPFYIYLDEFQHFITPTLEGILSGARKYGLGLVLAHQSLDQVMRRDPLVGQSVLTNAGTRVCFRTNYQEAKQLTQGFSLYTPEDVQGLPTGQAIATLGQAHQDFLLTTVLPDPHPKAEDNRTKTLSASRITYGRALTELDLDLEKLFKRSVPRPSHKDPNEPAPKPPQADPVLEVSAIQEQVPFIPEAPQIEAGVSKDPGTFQTAVDAFKARSKQQTERTGHRQLQTYIKQLGEARGYLAKLEHPTPDGNGRVDVLLQKEKQTLAVEITVTTSNQHELGNIRKCLNAKYDQVVLICGSARRVQNLQELVEQELTKAERQRLLIQTSQQFLTWLDEQTAQAASTEQVVRGYRVKTNYQSLSAKESQAKQARLARILTQSKSRKDD